MSEIEVLKAQARDRVGKGASRELRRNKMVPAVIYGNKITPFSIAIPFKEIDQRINSGGFMTNVLMIEVDGKKHRVLPKDYQLDPVRDFPMHVDFLRISKDTSVTVEVPVQFINEEICVGLKKGGVLNIVRHTVEVDCPADTIPDAITIDLENYDLGDSVHISDIELPEGVLPNITDRDFTIVTIASPAGLKSDEDADEDEAEDTDAEDGEGDNADSSEE